MRLHSLICFNVSQMTFFYIIIEQKNTKIEGDTHVVIAVRHRLSIRMGVFDILIMFKH
jgi:hypothetical protein